MDSAKVVLINSNAAIWEFPTLGVPVGGPYHKDYGIVGSTLFGSAFWETTIQCSPP